MEDPKADAFKSILLLNPEEKADRKKLEEIRSEMDELRQELKTFRESNKTSEYTLESAVHDPEYMALMAEGDFSKNDADIHERIYPSLWKVEAERKERKAREAQQGLQNDQNWKTINNTIKVKEFEEDDADLELEAKRVKEGEEYEDLLKFAKIQSDFQSLSRKDIESYIIGGNIMSKLSSGFLFLMFYALYWYYIDDIPPAIRYLVGFAIGGGAYYLAHDSRDKNTTISYFWILTGLVIHFAYIYLGFWGKLGIGAYAWEAPIIFSKQSAFAALVLANLLLFVFAILHDRIMLAVTGLIIGYFAPFLIRDGGGNFVAYISYVYLLNLMVMVMAYLKQWKQLSFISFAHFIVAFLIWSLLDAFDSLSSTFVFFVALSVYYVTFYANFMIYGIIGGKNYDQSDNVFLQVNNAFYILLGIFAVWMLFDGYQGAAIFLEVVAIFNVIHLVVLYLKEQSKREIIVSLLVLVLVLTNVALVAQFFGNHINTVFAIEAVVLLWLGITLREDLLRQASFLSIVITILSLLGVWLHQYFLTSLDVAFMLNDAILASAMTFGSLLLTQLLLAEDEAEKVSIVPKEFFKRSLISAVLVIAFISIFMELALHTSELAWGYSFRVLILISYVISFTIILRFVAFQTKLERLHVPVWGLMAFSVAFYFLYGHFQTLELRSLFVLEDQPAYPFLFHYVIILLSALVIFLVIRDIIAFEGYGSQWYSYSIWFASLTAFVHLTMELEHIVVIISSADVSRDIDAVLGHTRRTGWTVAWAVLALGYMSTGIYYKVQQIRLIALFFFGLTIIKFGLYDFWFIGPLGKIFTGIVLAAIFYAVSKMYKKLAVIFQGEGFSLDKDQRLSKEDILNLLRLKKAKENQDGSDE